MNVYVAEFLGTAILVLFGGGVCANVNLKRNLGHGSDWIVIAVGWGARCLFRRLCCLQYFGRPLKTRRNSFQNPFKLYTL